MVISMQRMDNNSLAKINGGFSVWTGLAIAAIVVFIAGILEGQIKLKWQKLKNTVFKGNFVEKPSIQIHQEDAIMYIKL